MTKKGVVIAFITVLFLVGMLSGIIVYVLLNFVKSDTTIRPPSTLSVKKGYDANITLQVNKSDRIYLALDTFSNVEVKVEPTAALRQLPFDVEGLPFEFEDWIICKQRFLFIANESSNSTLSLSFKNPKIPYAIEVFEGKANYTLFSYLDEKSVNYIGVHVQALTNQSSRFQQVILIYPYNQVAEQNFQINGSLKLIGGRVSYINLFFVTRDRAWFVYGLVPKKEINVSKTVNFNVDLYNLTLSGRSFSEDFGKQIHYIGISIGLDSLQWSNNGEGHAKIGIGEVKIRNGNETTIINPKISESYLVDYNLYILHKFHPTVAYTLSILVLIFLVCIGALMLARLTGVEFKVQWFFKHLVTSEAESNPEPNTYLAKLFHKPHVLRGPNLNDFGWRARIAKACMHKYRSRRISLNK